MSSNHVIIVTITFLAELEKVTHVHCIYLSSGMCQTIFLDCSDIDFYSTFVLFMAKHDIISFTLSITVWHPINYSIQYNFTFLCTLE